MTTLKILVFDKTRKRIWTAIEGHIVADYFGIHHLLTSDGSFHRRGWSIVHLPSGLLITSTYTYRDAKAVVTRLAALPIDWRTIDDETLTDDQRKLIKSAIAPNTLPAATTTD